MIAEQLINHSIPPLKPTDNSQKALLWMEEMRVNQLPVIHDRKFSGMLSEEMILEYNDIDALVKDFKLMGKNCYVKDSQHLFDVLKQSTDHNVDLVPVLDEQRNYLGVVTIQDGIKSLASSSAVQHPGGILILSMRAVDYSLAEISRLVESNQVKILTVFTRVDEENPHMMTVTLKLNKDDLRHVIATLERFEYEVIARFEKKNVRYSEKDRLDLLMKYLDI